MDSTRIPNLIGTLASRRTAVAFLGGLLGTVAPRFTASNAAARKHGKRKKQRKHKKGPQTKVTATCPGEGLLGSGTTNGSNRIAQTFVALVSGPLVKARLAMLSAFETSGDFELRLVETDGAGQPSEKVLATSTVASDRVPNERGDVDFTFAKPFVVKAGTEYALVLTRPGGGVFAWFGQEDRRCPGNPFFSESQSEPFDPLAATTFDHTYTVFVRA